jgi:ribonucleoside-diphosphate reductase alpha chain
MTEKPRASVAVAAEAPRSEAASTVKEEVAGPTGVPVANGHVANGHAANGNGNGGKGNASTITLSLGTTNVAFKIQEDAPSCAECGSIMVRNGSCYKCLNCGSTSGCS